VGAGPAILQRDTGCPTRARPERIPGLNWNHNHEMQNLFKSTATAASVRERSVAGILSGLLSKGMRPEDGAADAGAQDRRHHAEDLEEEEETFDAEYLKLQAA